MPFSILTLRLTVETDHLITAEAINHIAETAIHDGAFKRCLLPPLRHELMARGGLPAIVTDEDVLVELLSAETRAHDDASILIAGSAAPLPGSGPEVAEPAEGSA